MAEDIHNMFWSYMQITNKDRAISAKMLQLEDQWQNEN